MMTPDPEVAPSVAAPFRPPQDNAVAEPSTRIPAPLPRPPRSHQWRIQLGLLPVDAALPTNIGGYQDLIGARNGQYQEWVQQFPYPSKPQPEEEDEPMDVPAGNIEPQAPTNSHAADMDPLTAMMMEENQKTERQLQLDLQYRKERARRKRTPQQQRVVEADTDFDETAVCLQIIDKDLHRLAHPAVDNGASTPNLLGKEERTERLRQILFIYHCRNPEPGYRQGMHEIASYVLFCLELDSTSNSDESLLESESYWILDCILRELQIAFDVTPTQQYAEKPLQGMSRRILALIARCDGTFHQLLVELQVPPEIYLTKWIRLLFSREVPTTKAVLELWDFIFERVFDGYACMAVLEAMAAARLLHHRQELLQSFDGCLHLLMNLPPEQDMGAILEIVMPLLTGQPIVLPPLVRNATASQATTPGPTTTPANGHSMTPSLDVNSAMLSMKRLSFSKVTEQISTKTQSISKRLYQEWENMATVPDDPLSQRSYDDPGWQSAWNQGDVVAASGAAAMPPKRPLPHDATLTASQPDQQQQKTSFSPLQWGQEMEIHLAVLQNFVMTIEKESQQQGDQTKVVPNAVWESLADLEVLRQDILKYAK